MHGNCSDIADGIHVPYLSKELFLGKYVIGIFSKECKKIKLLSGKALLLVINVYSSGGLINLKSTDFNKVISLMP